MTTQTETFSQPFPLSASSSLSRFQSWGRSFLHNAWLPIPLILIALIGRHYEFSNWPGSYVMHIAMLVGINIILAISLQLINGVSGQFSLGHAGFMAIGAYLAAYGTLTFGPLGYDADADYPNPLQLFANPGAVLIYFIALAIAAAVAGIVAAVLFAAIRKTKSLHSSLPILLTLAILTWIVFDARSASAPEQIPATAVWSRGAVALVHLYSGVIVRGSGFALWLTHHVPVKFCKPLTFAIALLGGGAAAAVAGLLVGLPTLRLRGDYLAIATLGFAEIIRNIIVTIPAIGAATGLSVNVYWTRASEPDHIYAQDQFFMFPWIYCIAALTLIIISRLVGSPKGRAILAVREDEVAAAAMGIDPTHHKVLAFIVGAFFAGVAGALYAHVDGYLNTNSYSFMKSIEIVVMVTLGGMGSLWGAAIAAAALTILPEALDNADRFLPKSLAKPAHWMADNRLVVYAALLIIIMLIRARWRDGYRWLFHSNRSAP